MSRWASTKMTSLSAAKTCQQKDFSQHQETLKDQQNVQIADLNLNATTEQNAVDVGTSDSYKMYKLHGHGRATIGTKWTRCRH